MLIRVFVLLLLTVIQPAQAAVMLIYHHVANDTPRVTSVTPDELRQHLQYFKDNNFQVIGLDKLIHQLKNGEQLADNAVVITINDVMKGRLITSVL